MRRQPAAPTSNADRIADDLAQVIEDTRGAGAASARQIVAPLNAEGVPAPHGQGAWQTTLVLRVLSGVGVAAVRPRARGNCSSAPLGTAINGSYVCQAPVGWVVCFFRSVLGHLRCEGWSRHCSDLWRCNATTLLLRRSWSASAGAAGGVLNGAEGNESMVVKRFRRSRNMIATRLNMLKPPLS